MSASSSDGRRTAAAAERLDGAGRGCMSFGVQDTEVEEVKAAVESSKECDATVRIERHLK